jgi:peptidoglycan hydrolase-like amidase
MVSGAAALAAGWVYMGYATTSTVGIRTVHETSNGEATATATAGRVVTYGGSPALTQFSSSNGGYSAPGACPYLAAQPDTYDSVVCSNTWTPTLPATIARAYPAVGTVQALQVLARDGYWRYGGRVVSIKITGSAASATVTGLAFPLATGLRSTLFVIDEAS